VHGVMNTDNMSILGLTIDYGPYGWLEDFDPGWTPNTTDASGRRYRFGQQAQVAHWNLAQLANALVPLFETTEALEAGLDHFAATFEAEQQRMTTAKCGFGQWREGDTDLVGDLYTLLRKAEVDMTIFFRSLADVDLGQPALEPLRGAFYSDEKFMANKTEFVAWLARYAERAAAEGIPAHVRRERMNAVNPRYVMRNYLAQEAIDLAEQGDTRRIDELLEVMRHPYDDQPGRERFAEKRPDWARTRAGCSMLSCSS